MNKAAIQTIVLFIVLLTGIIGWYEWREWRGATETVGGQKDEHGCLIAAGYSWCAARGECERSWERYCTGAPAKKVLFTCDGGKTIEAAFYPSDDAFVDLVLSDGRSVSIPRAVSASGARYAKSDESFVFWNKGDTAFVTEEGTTTFSNCGISSNAQPAVTVLFPKGGEQLEQGKTYQLLWEGGSDTVAIFLIDRSLKETGASVSISDRVYGIRNQHTYQYTIPKDMKAGDYEFQIGDATSLPFSIVKPK